jgi:serine phosphatase RsbU (regulator of sigma subunit)
MSRPRDVSSSHALVVGDVSGHDLAAAGVMAALRYTIRTLAKLGVAPDEILERAAQELDVVTDDHFATVLVGMVDMRMEELTLASAGHPPPLLLDEGRARFLNLAPGVPLGVAGPRPEPITIHFSPGSTLVVFTDGLIDRRGQSLDEGLQRFGRGGRC